MKAGALGWVVVRWTGRGISSMRVRPLEIVDELRGIPRGVWLGGASCVKGSHPGGRFC